MKKHAKQEEDAGLIGRIRSYMIENEQMLKRYGMIAKVVVHFPTHRRIPLFSKLALWILRMQSGILDIKFEDVKHQ